MRRLALLSSLCLTALLVAAVAHAELAADKNLRLSFNASFSPRALPRDQAVPVRVKIDGKVKTVDGTRPPQLRHITMALNRHGVIFSKGLPTCASGRLETTSPEVALKNCRSALVGRGSFRATVDMPDLEPFPVVGSVLAFNGRPGGKPAILLHVNGKSPIDATIVLTFRIGTNAKGEYGTVLTTKIPRIAADLGYVSDLSLELGRTYRYRGERRSFISARCAAPSGFPGAMFPFAKGTFHFADGTRLATTLIRDCTVRR